MILYGYITNGKADLECVNRTTHDEQQYLSTYWQKCTHPLEKSKRVFLVHWMSAYHPTLSERMREAGQGCFFGTPMA